MNRKEVAEGGKRRDVALQGSRSLADWLKGDLIPHPGAENT